MGFELRPSFLLSRRRYLNMDAWFPTLVLFCGLFLQGSLQVPEARAKIAKYHPIPDSFRRMDAASWLFIIVGSLWGLQDLLV